MKVFVSTRNKWKWIFIYLPIVLIFVIGISFWINHDVQSNAPYQVAAYAAMHNSQLVAQYGNIQSVKLVSEDAHTNVSGNNGYAKIVLLVSGDKTSATVTAHLEMHSGIWEVIQMQSGGSTDGSAP